MNGFTQPAVIVACVLVVLWVFFWGVAGYGYKKDNKLLAIVAIVLLSAVILLSGCVKETALDPQVGQVMVRHYTPEDCGMKYQYTYGDYRYVYDCDPPEWTFSVRWKAQRYSNDETGEIRTVAEHTSSGFRVDKGVYDDCPTNNWITVDGNTVIRCSKIGE